MTTYEIDSPLVGDPASAPAGLVLTSTNTPAFKALRTDAGWVDTNGSFHEPATSGWRSDEYVVAALPDREKDTLTRFVQRFRTTAIGASYANSINIDQVRRALTAIGCDDIDTPVSIGMLVHHSDRDLVDSLPDGTILRAGRGDIWDLQAWMVKHGGVLHHVLGPVRTTGHDLLTVHRIPGVTEPEGWVTEPYDESMQPEIDAFKDRAYELGLKAKGAHQWCGQYEVAMARLGIDEAWHNRPRPMDPDSVKGMPVGTVLVRYDAENPARHAYYRRTDDGDDTWGVEVIYSSVEEWTTPDPDMGLVAAQTSDFEGGLRASVINPNLWASLPIGTEVRTQHHVITHTRPGWTEQPHRTDRSAIITNLRDYMPYRPHVTRFGDGTWRYGEIVEDGAVDEQPDGTWLASFYHDPPSMVIRHRVDGDWETYVEGSVTTEVIGEGHRVIGIEGDEHPGLLEWTWLDYLPIGTTVIDTPSQVTYRKGPRGWINRGHAIPARDLATHARNGRLRIVGVPEGEVDPRIGQPLTEEMIDALPVGSTIYGTRSGSTYTVTATGILRSGRRTEQEWSEFSDAMRSGRLIVDTIAVPLSEIEWQHHGIEVGTRLTSDTDVSVIDSLPPGTQLFGCTSRNIYLREGASGWREVETGNRYESVAGFSPRNCMVHALGSLSGDGTVAVESDTPKREYPR